MKPVSYQTMPSSMNGGHLALDRVLSIPNVLHCEKCGFASTDAAVFKKHMNEHAGTRFYCFYCNDVSFSEAELNAHLKQHTEKHPYKCPHCGQGYMRRLCLVKHIDRLHSNGNTYGPAKSGMAKIPHVPVSGALSSVPTVDLTSLRPVVRVTVPTSSAPAFRQDKDEQRGKGRDINVPNATGNTERFSPLNGLTQQNRALTVSLPEEVTIPAGCLVELVEVKTVNGTKELKLRLISQQENESVIKDTRTAVSQNTASAKQLSSMLNHSNMVKSMSLGTCTINKKQYETKALNVERPAVVPVSTSKNLSNQTSNSKIGLKRNHQDVINLECPSVLPNKIPKIFSPVREGNGAIKVAQREPVNHNAASPSAALTRAINRSTSTMPPQNKGTAVSQRAVEERRNSTPEHSKIISPRGGNNVKSIPRDVPMPVKLEPNKSHLKNNAASISVSLPGAGQRRPPTVSICNDNVVNRSFSVPKTLNEPTAYKSSVLSNHINSKIPAWNKEVRSDERAREGYVQEPEGFPVISSVFSLSQQPEDEKGSIQPLVMALRGIVMDKNNRSVPKAQDPTKTKDGTKQVNESPTSGYCAPVATQIEPSKGDPVLTEGTSEPATGEGCHKGIQHPPALAHSHVKVEENNVKHTDDDKCSAPPQSKSLNKEEIVSKTTADVEASGTTADPQPQLTKSESDMSSKFLTVSLKRVQLGVWKKSKKGLKLRISKYKTQVSMDSLTDYTVIYPMPLKVDQLVKRPGPNQPVVVLNHPKPRASIQGVSTDALADVGASEAVPKCQILKMRLSKVMGQKYEVMGCTVGDFP